MKSDRLSAMLTPMSRTRAARSAYSASSRSGVPNSFTSRAPATLKRSVIRDPMSAFNDICRWARPASRRPMNFAGNRKTGTSSRAPSVSGQESANMVPTTRATEMMLLTTLDSTDVNACCAPMTSLFSRETSEPVWARVKNAMGCFNTWPKTSVRRSRIRPSPMREENHRCTTVRAASSRAIPATTKASRTTTPPSPGITPLSTISRNRSGTATTSTALMTTIPRNAAIDTR